MKLAAIKRVCKRDGEYVIFNEDDGQQWIGTVNACYEVQGVRIQPQSIGALLDVDLNGKGADVREEQFKCSALCPREDTVPADLEMMIGISGNGEALRIFSDGERIYMVNEVFIKPAIHENSGYITFKATENTFGNQLILIGDGMLTTAIIRPESDGATDVIMHAMRSIIEIYSRKSGEEHA